MLRLSLPLSLALSACSLAPGMPDEPPALRDMEEPLDLRGEPDDEAARRALPLGSFSGLYLKDSRDTLAARLDDDGVLEVERVVENSPAAAAGLRLGDLVLEATVGDGAPVELRRPSQWRELELATKPGAVVTLLVDRAGREAEATLTLAARVAPAERVASERYREEQRVGVVLRTATEVEARGAGLGPGGGAVIVGLSARSPWRDAGLRFEDVLVAVDEQAIAHPQDLLAAIRDPERDELTLAFVRDGRRATATAALTSREHEFSEIYVPLLYSYEYERGHTEWTLLTGLLGYESTAAAWRFQLLWLIGFGGGDADTLLEGS